MSLPSASNLSRASVCAASWALPWVQEDTRDTRKGDAGHLYFERLTQGASPEQALAQVPVEYRSICEAIDLAALAPLLGVGSLAEVTLALDVEFGTARSLGAGLGRRYPEAAAGEMLGTADLLIFGHGSVRVIDYKFGSGHASYTPPLERNMQLRFLGLAAARLARQPAATIGVLSIADDGSHKLEEALLLAADLDAIQEDLYHLAKRVRVAQAAVKAGKTPSVRTGDHCHFCPAKVACPAFGEVFRRLVQRPGDLEHEVKALMTPERMGEAYRLARMAQSAANRMVGAFFGMAAQVGSVPLGDGLVLGEVVSRREELVGDVVHQVVTELHGRDVADAAVERSATKASLERALSTVAAKGQLAGLRRQALDAVKARGGVREKVTREIKERRERVAANEPAGSPTAVEPVAMGAAGAGGTSR